MSDQTDAYDRFLERYDDERVPWDDPEPPPEIKELSEKLTPGLAIDLGCGYGRVSIYLAKRGWTVDGIDFIPKAIAVASERAAAEGVAERARFHLASAAKLDFLTSSYDLAIDIGCMHSFSEEMLRSYMSELVRLLRRGGLYILFAHLRQEDLPDAGVDPRGIPEETVLALTADNFNLERVEYGVTQVEDRPPWDSAWFWFQRR